MRVVVLVPGGPVTVRLMVLVPAVAYVWTTVVAVVFVVVPSPKFQRRLVMYPAELSVNVTFKGVWPKRGAALKLADGVRSALVSNFTR